jgi:hypothetical protein
MRMSMSMSVGERRGKSLMYCYCCTVVVLLYCCCCTVVVLLLYCCCVVVVAWVNATS